jgi:tetratricopeptide (TPR) repeat protein
MKPGKFAPLALVLLTLLAYSNSFQVSFVLDNRGLILNDPRLRDPSSANIQLILHHTYWWPNGESGLYRPLTTLSYLFNYSVLGNREQPGGYHWLNFLLHSGNVLLVYALAVRFMRRFWPAFFVAALWAVHPVLTESVSNIVGRADLLAAAAVLGGFLLYLKSVDSAGWHRLAYVAALAAVTAIGVFSKESAVVLPGVIVLYELAFRKGRTWGRAHAIGLLATLVPVALMLYQRSQVLAGTLPMEIPFTDNPIAGADFWSGRLTALKVIARYFGLIVWPAILSADYSWAQIPLANGSLRDWIAIAAALAIIPVTVFLYRWNRAAFFFFCVGLIWLAPVANLLFPTGTLMAERFLYLPALGVIACLVPAIYAVAERARAGRFALIVLGLLTAALACRTWVRNGDWKDDLSMASSLVRTSPRSFKAHDLLANVLFASDPSHANIDRVIAESEKSRAILEPLSDARQPADPYRFAANCYMIRGAYRKAIAVLLRYIAVEDAVAPARSEAEAYLLLSAAYLSAGETAKARDAAAKARGIDPLSPQLYREMADTAASAGKMDDAAVALIEGAFVTSDKTLRQDLVELYRRAMDPGSCVLMPGPNGPAIDPSCAAVHAHVCAASAYVVRTLAAAQQRDLAQTRKTMFVQQFGCPEGPLDEALP